MTTNVPEPLTIPDEAKERIKLLFIAKHVFGGGRMHHEDGNHAVYHHQMRSSLETLNLRLHLANTYSVMYEHPGVDFVFPLLNRGGFMNSEMLLPLLCNKHGIPYVGANPFMRGMGDDKSISKTVAQRVGVPTCDWFCYRRGAPVREEDCPKSANGRWIIKPNASSASWGIKDAFDWATIKESIEGIHGEGHDVIVEPYIDGYDVQVAFISINGPVMLPMLIYEREEPARLWTYSEKRDLIDNTEKNTLKTFTDPEFASTIEDYSKRVAREFEPFDYGRMEFRLNRATGEINFIEINLNCNLWSEKVMAKAASYAGFSHPQLIETILAESYRRNGLID